jgi:hypothetical protein
MVSGDEVHLCGRGFAAAAFEPLQNFHDEGSVAKCWCSDEDGLNEGELVMSEFKWRQFEGEIILWAVRWYCRYGISYRDLEQMMGERGVPVDHSTIYRWKGTRRRSKSGCAGSGVARSRRAGGWMRPT